MAIPQFNKVLCGDNFEIMRSMDAGSVDLIYLDPPFNSGADWGEFDDRWEWDDYLDFMRARLTQCHRLLADTGSIYLHCDPTMSHYLKLVMDAIWGRSNFRNEIVWSYSGGGVPRKAFARKHDIILFYAQSAATGFNIQRRPYAESCSNSHSDGTLIDKERGAHMTAVWGDLAPVNTQAKERTGYPTQKPLKLLERIIAASSNPGDTVFDPFCGCATTLVAAERLGRSWIGCDVSPLAAELVNHRIHDTQGLFAAITHRTDRPQRTDLGEIRRYNHPDNRRHLYGEQALRVVNTMVD